MLTMFTTLLLRLNINILIFANKLLTQSTAEADGILIS